MFNEDELLNIYHCVAVMAVQREKSNEVTQALSDEKFVDPILDRLYSLEVKVLRELDKIRENENG
jgi:hypothetical protein